jgi:hypothetical protein
MAIDKILSRRSIDPVMHILALLERANMKLRHQENIEFELSRVRELEQSLSEAQKSLLSKLAQTVSPDVYVRWRGGNSTLP